MAYLLQGVFIVTRVDPVVEFNNASPGAVKLLSNFTTGLIKAVLADILQTTWNQQQ